MVISLFVALLATIAATVVMHLFLHGHPEDAVRANVVIFVVVQVATYAALSIARRR